MNLKRQIFLINLYTGLIHTIFVLAIIVPYYENQIGLTFQQFMIGEAVFAAVVIAMEIPSGWLSDVWNRKYTLMVGSMIALMGYTGLLLANNFPMAVLSQAIVGVGVAFNSGTVTSILYDSLAMKGKEHLYQRLEGKRHGVGLYSIAGASIAGGFLYQYNVYLPLILDIATLGLAVLVAFLLVEPTRIKRKNEHHPLRDMMITIKYALHGHKEIAGIIIVGTVLFCTTKFAMWSQQPYMQHVGIPTAWFGVIMASGFLFGGLSGQLGHHIKHTLSNRAMMGLMTFVTASGMLLAAIINMPVGIVCILFLSGIWGFGFPFMQNAINKHADPTRRATILSTFGLLVSLMFIPASLVVGFLDDNYSILYALGYLSAQLVIMGSIGLWIWRRGVKETHQ